MLEASIDEVFVRDPYEPKYLGETKAEAPTMDAYRFHLSHKITAIMTFSHDPSDGYDHALLIGMFIDGKEVQYVTDWIPNQDDDRDREYTLEIPNKPVSLMSTKKVHSVQFKLGTRKTKFSIPLKPLEKRVYNLAESPVFYYRIGSQDGGDLLSDNTGPTGAPVSSDSAPSGSGGSCGSCK
jgi:hypothetical protein